MRMEKMEFTQVFKLCDQLERTLLNTIEVEMVWKESLKTTFVLLMDLNRYFSI